MSARAAIEGVLGQALVVRALTLIGFGLGVFAPLITKVAGSPVLAGAVATVMVFFLGALWSLRLELQARHLPLTLVAFVAFAVASLVWTRYPLEAAAGLAALVGFGVIGACIAISRDLSQIIRGVGQVLRVAVVGSAAIEVFSGIIIDSPLPALGVHGNITRWGPLQGLATTPDLLAFLCVLAGVTTYVELRMRSVTVLTGVGTIVVAVALLSATRSAFGTLMAVAAVLGVLALSWIGQAPREERSTRQAAVAVIALILIFLAWLARWPIALALNGYNEVQYRQGVWRQVLALFPFNNIFGRGFFGRWNLDVPPYSEIRNVQSHVVRDAASAYVDVLFQLGLVGLALFLVALAAALIRSWLLAARRRAIVYRWPALAMLVYAVAALGMSEMLVEFGWMLLVVCAVKASHELSWRSALEGAR